MGKRLTDHFYDLVWDLSEETGDPIANELISQSESEENKIQLVCTLDYNNSQELPIEELSFLPAKKTAIFDLDTGIPLGKGRQVSTIGRVIRAMLEDKKQPIPMFTDEQYERFVNRVKAKRAAENGYFEIVKGEDIRHYYHEENYFDYENEPSSGSLWGSCMKYESCQEYFDVYVENATMLVYLNKDRKLLGRALIWNTNQGIFMDRIYVYKDYMEHMFISHARANGWIYKRSQSSSLPAEVWMPNRAGNGYISEFCFLEVRLKNTYDTMPYMDTMKVYNLNTKTLSNLGYKDSSYSDDIDAQIYLEDTEGHIEEIDRFAKCSYDNRFYDIEDMVEVDHELVYYENTLTTRFGSTVISGDPNIVELENDYGIASLKLDIDYIRKVGDKYYSIVDPQYNSIIQKEDELLEY